MQVPLRCFHFNVKVPKKLEKNVKVNMCLRKGHDFSDQVLHRGAKKNFLNLVMLYIAKLRILYRLQKYKLASVTKCTKKSYWQRKMLKKLLLVAFLGENT